MQKMTKKRCCFQLAVLSTTAVFLSGCGDSDNSPAVIVPPLPTASATIALSGSISDDDSISQAEINTGLPIAVTGTTGGDVADNDTVTITANGKTFTGVVSANAFSIDIPVADLAADSDTNIEASVTTSTGFANGEATASASDSYTVEAVITASLSLSSSVTADNQISQLEIQAGMAIDIAGSSGGDFTNGDTVTINVNNKSFTATLSAGTFTVSVPVADLAADTSVSATATTSTGNSGGEKTATDTTNYTVEPVISASITLDVNITDDDIISLAEITAAQAIDITGAVGGDVADSDTVTLTINGQTYTAAVAAGKFVISVPVAELQADEDTTIEASVTTTTGNSAGEKTASDTETYTVESDGDFSAGELIDPNATEDNLFGSHVLVLDNGNVLVASPGDSSVTSFGGAVHLYDGSTRQIIKSIYGGNDDGEFGRDGFMKLNNGNVVISSTRDGTDSFDQVGSVMLINGATGDQVGSTFVGLTFQERLGSGGIIALPNDNFIISSPSTRLLGGNIDGVGSARLVNGSTGDPIGTVIEGEKRFDSLGNGGVVALANNNFVIASPSYDSPTVINSGKVALYSGTDATLIGTPVYGNNIDDFWGQAVFALQNSNIVVRNWSDNIDFEDEAGSVLLLNGTTGAQIGSTYEGVKENDNIGRTSVVELNNGNFVVVSADADSGVLVDVGSVVLFDGTTGEEISVFQGLSANDSAGSGGITTLGNNNFAISSVDWNSFNRPKVGAVQLINGSTGAAIGIMTIGAKENDAVGSGGVIALTNDNIALASPLADSTARNAGSVQLMNGATGAIINTIRGDNSEDNLGRDGIVGLDNANFAVASSLYDVSGVQNSGGVILVNGSTGVRIGNINAASVVNTFFGNAGLTALPNNQYLVRSNNVEVNDIINAGAIQMYSGVTNQSIIGDTFGQSSDFFNSANTQITVIDENFYIVGAPNAANNGSSNSGFVTIVAKVNSGVIASVPKPIK